LNGYKPMKIRKKSRDEIRKDPEFEMEECGSE
jgi:hypothetical protein